MKKAVVFAIILLILAVAALSIRKEYQHGTTVAINVTEKNLSWVIVNSGDTSVDVDVYDGITGFVIRNLGIGNKSEIPKKNVEITARQNG